MFRHRFLYACTLGLLLAAHATSARAQDGAPAPLPEEGVPPPTPDVPPAEIPREIPPPPNPDSPPPPAQAVAPASDETRAWYEDLSLNALVSGSVIHNFAAPQPLAGGNIGRVFDRDNDSIKLDVVELVVQDEPESVGEAGFRIDLVHGQTIPAVIGGGDIAVQQAYVSYIASLGKGLRFDLGTFVSHIGAETIEGFDNVNDTYSRSFLFSAAPPQLTGGRVTYRFGDMLSLTGLVVNGWSPNVIDNNTGKTLGLQAAFNPSPLFALFVHYLAGPEKAGNNHDWRQLVDAVAVLRLHPVVLTLEGLLGREQNRGASDSGWGGVLLAARWDVGGGVTLVARGEYFDDRQSARNLGTQLVEASLGPSLKLTDSALLRLEYRHDHSVGPAVAVFNTAHGHSTQQNTLAANLLFVF